MRPLIQTRYPRTPVADCLEIPGIVLCMLYKIVPRGNKNIKVILGKHKLSVQLESQVSEACLVLVQNHHEAQAEMETDNETCCTWMVLFINESYLCHVACFPISPLHPTPISFFNLPWDFATMKKLKSLLKSTVFLPTCYGAVMRGNEVMTLWKYNIKIHKNG